MEQLARLLTDTVTVTLYFAMAVGTFIGYINRRGEERSRGWLYLSLLFQFLSHMVFMDNALVTYLIPFPLESLSWRIPVVVFIYFGVYCTASLSLEEEFQLQKRQRLPIRVSQAVLLVVSLITLRGINKPWWWYLKYLVIPVLAAFGLAVLFILVYFLFFLIKKRKYKDFRSILAYCGTCTMGLFIYITKIVLQKNTHLYQSHSYLLLVVFILVFITLLSGQSHRDYKELMELRKSQELLNRQNSSSKDSFSRISRLLNNGELPFRLSEREKIITRDLCEGKLYKEMASELEISLSSVKKSAHSIYKKASVQNRVELIRLLLQM